MDDDNGESSEAAPQFPAKEPQPRSGGGLRYLKVLGFLAWTAGVAGLGIGGGLRLADSLDEESIAPVQVQVALGADEVDSSSDDGSATVGGAADRVLMPDVVGLTVNEAMEALVDSGIPPSIVIEVETEWIDEPGRVVTQRPVQGQLDPGGVFLGVSVAATVPEVIGLPVEQALPRLQSIGIVPVTERRYEPGVDAGTVLETRPAAGATATGNLTVISAAAPSAVFATSVSASERDCSIRSDLDIAGADQETGLRCRMRTGADDPTRQTYQVESLADAFTAVAGLPGSAAEGTVVGLTVVVDGVERESVLLVPRAQAELEIDLVGATELVLELRAIEGPDTTIQANIGQPVFLGDPVNMNILESR